MLDTIKKIENLASSPEMSRASLQALLDDLTEERNAQESKIDNLNNQIMAFEAKANKDNDEYAELEEKVIESSDLLEEQIIEEFRDRLNEYRKRKYR